MKSFTAFIQILFLLINLTVMSLPTHANVSQCDTLRVGGPTNWKPVSYYNHDLKKAQGVSKDVLKVVARQLKLKTAFNYSQDWLKTVAEVDSGSMDLFAGLYWTEERASKYHYSDAYFTNQLVLFTKSGELFSFKSLKDLKGRVGVIPEGMSLGNKFDRFAKRNGLNLIRVKHKQDMFTLVEQGKAGYFVLDKLDAQFQFKHLVTQFSMAPKLFAKVDVHFVFSKHSECFKLIPEINGIIKTLKSTGKLKQNLQRYIKTLS